MSYNFKIIYLKRISEEGLLFNYNVQITNASLKFLIKLPAQKTKISLYKFYIANLKSFSNQYSNSAFKLSSINLIIFSTIFIFVHVNN